MEAVHRHEHRRVAERVRDEPRERRLAAAGRPGDAEDRAPAARCERARAGEQRVEVVDDHGHYGRALRRSIVTILAGLAILCVAAVIDVTLLGGDGKVRRGIARDCLTILEDRTPCGRLRRVVPHHEGGADVGRLPEAAAAE